VPGAVTDPPSRSRRAPVAALLEAGDALVATVEAQLRAAVPPGVALHDAHTHVGTDEDGMTGDPDELVAMLDRHGVARAFTFCLNETDRADGFHAANDRTLAHAARAGGRLVPFARLDLAGDAAAEAERCLDRGAGGIKLHPRAQGFALDDPRLARVFAVAAERRVPILVHGGPGVPGGFAAALLRLADAHPGTRLIVAHAGVADLDALAERFAGRPDVAFDTSTWGVVDVLDLLARVAPQQVLHGSDYPYGQQPSALAVALCAARASGLDDAELSSLLGGSAARLAAGEELGALSPARGAASLCRPLAHLRVHQHLTMAAGQLLSRRRDALGALELAIAACAKDRDAELPRIGAMLRTARALWHALGALDSDEQRRTTARAAIQLLQLADTLVMTIPQEDRQ
jgi:predicted TIM-barrel fold metal-dependent hydrolase